MFQLRKKTIAVTTAAFVITGGGAAFAYWTTTGSGTSGPVSNAATADSLTLAASFTAGITPGDSRTVTYTGTNAGTTDLRVDGSIHAEVSTDKAGCLASWFHIDDVASNVTVPAGAASPTTVGTSTLSLDNLPSTNQDACKGAKVTLALTTVPSL